VRIAVTARSRGTLTRIGNDQPHKKIDFRITEA